MRFLTTSNFVRITDVLGTGDSREYEYGVFYTQSNPLKKEKLKGPTTWKLDNPKK